MATKKRIELAVHDRLRADSPEQIEKAGGLWKTLPLGFFYVNSEDAVDIAMIETLVALLREEGRALPKAVIRNLVLTISLTSAVKSAIAAMWISNLSAE